MPQAVTNSLPLADIREICRQYEVARLILFGSFATGRDRPDSDIDMLVEFATNDLGPWMRRFHDLQDALSRLLGRDVDLVLRSGLKWTIETEVMAEARLLYEK